MRSDQHLRLAPYFTPYQYYFKRSFLFFLKLLEEYIFENYRCDWLINRLRTEWWWWVTHFGLVAIICHWCTTFSKTWMNGLYWQFVTPNLRREQQTKMSNAVVSSRMRRFSRFFSILLISGAIDVDDFTCPSLVFSGTRKQHQRGPVSRNWVRANPTNITKAFWGRKRLP